MDFQEIEIFNMTNFDENFDLQKFIRVCSNSIKYKQTVFTPAPRNQPQNQPPIMLLEDYGHPAKA